MVTITRHFDVFFWTIIRGEIEDDDGIEIVITLKKYQKCQSRLLYSHVEDNNNYTLYSKVQ